MYALYNSDQALRRMQAQTCEGYRFRRLLLGVCQRGWQKPVYFGEAEGEAETWKKGGAAGGAGEQLQGRQQSASAALDAYVVDRR